MFETRLHADLIRPSHSGGSTMPPHPAFLDVSMKLRPLHYFVGQQSISFDIVTFFLNTFDFDLEIPYAVTTLSWRAP